MQPDIRPIGLLDSGVGGLSVLREVHKQLPNEDILYFADQGHVPYGQRPIEEIHRFSLEITRFLLDNQAKVIVVACNTASAASLHTLRHEFPSVTFVGMEPAVKPAAENTNCGVIGVIMTRATFQGELFASLIDRYASDVEVATQVCPDFVTLVEKGELDTPAAEDAARRYLKPLLEAGIDELVLGCTHFPFLTPVLQKVVGPDVEIIDPAPAVARQVGRVISGCRNDPDHEGQMSYFTSGDKDAFLLLAPRLLGEPVRPEQAAAVSWQAGRIVL
ncbi:MAG: glutamate racemase [Anaerolineae bacterium]|nr:glutamate racemase [Anaerolineae bacterium]